MKFPGNAKFCGRCGLPLRIVEEPASLRPDGVMWRIQECVSGRAPSDGHSWRVLKEYDIGPRFDPITGQPRRAA